MTSRRSFITTLGAGAAASLLDVNELRAGSSAANRSAWDTSWIDRLKSAEFRVVFNASEIADGVAMDYVSTFYHDFHEAHGTPDSALRPVVVFRRLGTEMAFNDAMWERYAIGESNKITDSATKAPAKRNVFWKTASGAPGDTKIETLQSRGMISLVCNVATENVGRRYAAKFQRDVTEVQNELKANLVPGAILVPSGIYALIRAQNAGCAWMPGT
jgi:intracellular sulfur oxidation DsrE/DsrF family protein